MFEMENIIYILIFLKIFHAIIGFVQSENDDVEIESEFENKNVHHYLDDIQYSDNVKRLKRNTENILKNYIEKLKNVMEITFIQL